MPEVKDFLNPASIMTPGIAGGLTASISLPLVTNFDLSFKWVALAISFILGLLIVFSYKETMPKMLRMLYSVLNSLIIFSVSVGTGITVDPPPKPPQLHSSTETNTTDPSTLLSLGSKLGKLLETPSIYANEISVTPPGSPQPSGNRSYLLSQNTASKKKLTKNEMEILIQQLENKARKERELREQREKQIKKYEGELEKYNTEVEKHNKRWSW
jgi:hypothetical protein